MNIDCDRDLQHNSVGFCNGTKQYLEQCCHINNIPRSPLMVTSWHGISYCIHGPSCGEQVINGFPIQRASNAEFWFFLLLAILSLWTIIRLVSEIKLHYAYWYSPGFFELDRHCSPVEYPGHIWDMIWDSLMWRHWNVINELLCWFPGGNNVLHFRLVSGALIIYEAPTLS